MNVLKIGLALAAAMVVTGCASIESNARSQVENSYKLPSDGSDIIYGVWIGDANFDEKKKACNGANNSDPRCSDADQTLGAVASAMGFAAGFVGVNAYHHKNIHIKPCTTGANDCTYVKVKVEPGKFGTVLETASLPGDGKCTWSGMPRIGGTICQAFNWDYKRNLHY